MNSHDNVGIVCPECRKRKTGSEYRKEREMKKAKEKTKKVILYFALEKIDKGKMRVI